MPKSCLSSVEMRTLAAIGGLLSTGKSSTATMTIFYQLPLWFCLTKVIKFRTFKYATGYSSFWKLKVLETKSRQTMFFDPGGCTGRLRACPFLGAWRALLCGEGFDWAPGGTRSWMEYFNGRMDDPDTIFRERDRRIVYAVLRSIAVSPRCQADTWSRQNL